MEKPLSDAERARICIEFAAHAREIRAALNETANKIANGDDTLRAEMRLIEEFLW